MSTIKDQGSEIPFIFFGTPHFAVFVLEEMEKGGMLPSLVITAPDRPVGRGLKMTPPPVKVWAEERKILVLQPEKLGQEFKSYFSNDSQNVNEGRSEEQELFVVASYGKIIPQSILDVPKHGTLNVHPSLLPKWRGASPIEAQILNDDKDIGVTIMLVDEKMDHGPILDQEFVDTPYWPMRGSELQDLLAHKGGALLARVMLDWMEGNIDAQEQEHRLATFCSKIQKEDGLIDLEADAYKNLLKIRALDVWPRTYFFTEDGKRVVITDADIEPARFEDHSGGDEKLVLKRVIPEGKKEIAYDNRMTDRFKVFCFKHDMESLILAAEEGLRQRLGQSQLRKVWKEPVEEQDLDEALQRPILLYVPYLRKDTRLCCLLSP